MADGTGATKATSMYNMIKREHKQRSICKKFRLEPSMNVYYEEAALWGGVVWRGNDLAGMDAGLSLLKQFVSERPHEGWSLSIYDTLSETTAEIDCTVDEIPQIASFVYNLEHAAPMTFVGENPITESYVVGMCCTRGRLDFPGLYRAENGNLKPVGRDGLDNRP